MLRKVWIAVVGLVACCLVVSGCGIERPPKPKEIVVSGGTTLPEVGIGFDIGYDPALDNLVPGYKILTVAYTNGSITLIKLDPTGDKWMVEDLRGRKILAITNLRDKDPETWTKLPEKLKVLIQYPLLVAVGSTQTIDLLVPNNVRLDAFKAVYFKEASSGGIFKILPRLD